VRADSHTHCCLSMHRFPPEMICCFWWSMRPVSIVFFNYRPPGCVIPHRRRHILFWVGQCEARLPNTKTVGTSRHCRLPLALTVLSQVTVPNLQSTAHRRAVNFRQFSMPSASAMFPPASRGKRGLHDGVMAVPTPPIQSKVSGSARFPDDFLDSLL